MVNKILQQIYFSSQRKTKRQAIIYHARRQKEIFIFKTVFITKTVD